jgi:modulator of FtsH protease
MTAYDASEWSDLFVATAGASAALAGLVFVAVSINLERILKYEGLPERALETLLLLIGVLVFSVVGLIPGQSHAALGAEMLGLGAFLLAAIVALPYSHKAVDGEPRHGLWTRWGIRLAATLPLIVGGASILAESGGGLYWVVAGIVLAVAGAVINAWVLLVEIVR